MRDYPMRFLLNWLSSLKLTVWILTLLIGAFFLGAFFMPLYPKAHEGMNAMPLFEWWLKIGREYGARNGWLILSILLMVILTINTLVCTVRSLRPGPSIWAHITHAGFLMILLAHLVTASTGFRESGIVLPRGQRVEIPRIDLKIILNKINYESYPGGMPKDYSAEVTLISKEGRLHKTLGPNRPAFYDGKPIYLKNLGFQPVPYAVCEVAHDPGARIALAGSIVFIIGSLPLPFLTRKVKGLSDE
jgi:hypothetical protein